mgnify:CR=1 FL=1
MRCRIRLQFPPQAARERKRGSAAVHQKWVTLFTQRQSGKTECRAHDGTGWGSKGKGHKAIPLGRLLLVPFLSGKEKEQHPVKQGANSQVPQRAAGASAPTTSKQIGAAGIGNITDGRLAIFPAYRLGGFLREANALLLSPHHSSAGFPISTKGVISYSLFSNQTAGSEPHGAVHRRRCAGGSQLQRAGR